MLQVSEQCLTSVMKSLQAMAGDPEFHKLDEHVQSRKLAYEAKKIDLILKAEARKKT